MSENLDEVDYNSSSIRVLKGLEAVRKRPGMYIGDTSDGSGLHHMVFEVLDNSIDEALAGYAKNIHIKILNDNSISVQDDGRGIPVDVHPDAGISAAEVIMTILHAGGKFDQNSYKVSGGLHGVGVSVVNALSKRVDVSIYRDGFEYHIAFEYGITVSPLKKIGVSEIRGTKVLFSADPEIFGEIKYKYDILAKRIKELSYLNSGIKIELFDESSNKSEIFYNDGGIKNFLVNELGAKKIIHEKIIEINKSFENVEVDLAFCWTDSYNESIFCFTNNIPQKDGGTHLTGLKNSLGRIVQKVMADNLTANKPSQKAKAEVISDDVREGMVCILSIKMPDPKFSSQTKEKLVSQEARHTVESVIEEYFETFLLENPQERKIILNKIEDSARVREASRKAKDLIRRKSVLESSFNLPGKLADCQSKEAELCEIYIVEGDSAGGSAKQGRDRKYQAILPLKGKILNIEKATHHKMLSSDEILVLISALGMGFGDTKDLSKLRYHRIIIMTDADVDGAHIRTLLLTFFYRQFPELIENGYLYIAQPPLYKIKHNKREQYLKDDSELNEYLTKLIVNNYSFFDLKTSTQIHETNILNVIKDYDRVVSDINNSLIKYVDSGFLHELMDVNLYDYFWLPLFNNSQINITDINKVIGGGYKLIQNGTATIVVKTHHGNSTSFDLNCDIFNDNIFANYINFVQSQKKIITNGIMVGLGSVNNNQYNFNSISPMMGFLKSEIYKQISLQRYKGLGEMNPEQLYETTMDFNIRRLVKINISDAISANSTLEMLMGGNVPLRRAFIEDNSFFAKNIDI